MYFISNSGLDFTINTICLPLNTPKEFQWAKFDQWKDHNAVVAGWGTLNMENGEFFKYQLQLKLNIQAEV